MTMLDAIKAKNRELVLKWGEGLMRKIERQFVQHSLIGDHVFFDPQDFEWVENIEANWPSIRQELDRILEHFEQLPNFQDLAKDEYRITQDDRWKTYFLYAFGIKAEKNCARCPETARLIETIPNMTTAFFSILLPGKQIPEHKGIYKGIIRYHLALKVPRDANSCAIKVGGETRHWQEGKSLIFDDLYPHSAWNNTDEIRAVLFLDFLRPVAFPYNILNKLIIKAISLTPYVQDGKENQRYWDEKLEQLFDDDQIS